MKTVPLIKLTPRLVCMPDKVLVTGTLLGSFSTDEVMVLRHVARLAAMVNDFDELQYAVKRAEQIRRNDAVLAKTDSEFQTASKAIHNDPQAQACTA